MAKGDPKVMLEVADTYYAPDGHTVLYGPGERHGLDEKLPADLRTRQVIVAEGGEHAHAPAPAQAAEAPAKPAAAKAESKSGSRA